MSIIIYAPEFLRRFEELPASVQKKAEKRERVFREDPFHHSLKTEKLQPKQKGYWSFRIDRDYRIVFRFERETIYFLTCGHHSWIYRYLAAH